MKIINKVENFAACIIFILLVLLPFSDLIIREIIRPFFSGIAKIPASQTLVSHLTLLIGFSGAIIASRDSKLLSLSNTSLFNDKVSGFSKHVTKWVSIFTVLLLAIGSLDLVLIELSFQYPVFIAPSLPRWIFQSAMPLGYFIIFIHLAGKMRNNIFSFSGLLTILLIILFLVSQDTLRENGFILIFGIIMFIFSVLNGAPIFTVLAGLGILLFWFDYVPISAVIAEAYRIVVSPHLATIPLFTLAGYFLAESKASDRLVNVFKALFGWLPGGTPVIVLLICGFFTALTGGSGVTILALGGLLFPMLIKDGYKKKFSLGLITASGSIGLLFPPSLPLILYGVTAGISIKSIFIAGILPGIFLIIVLSLWTVYSGELDKVEKNNFNLNDSINACWETKWELFIPFIVLYGIFGGHAKLVETAAFTVVYIFVIETFIYKDIDKKDIINIIVSCATLVGGVLIIIGAAMGLTSYMVDAQIPMKILSVMKELVSSKYVFLILLNIFLLIIGCLMDIFSAIIIVVPLIAPLGLYYGVDPIHLAIIFIANLELGYLTPPVGMNLFLSAYRFDEKMPEIYKSTFPFFIVLLFAVLCITYFPVLTLWLL
ncbi:MAG: TRAP transporter large permease subunit [Candidatus Neomarinimicrobiota bacterium]|nr:TRAP transporter large permease subunit [Candidatus Neomarinimicrobiota bacterium]